MDVKLNGINELRLALSGRENLDAVKTVVRKNGADMQRTAMRMVPVRTGTLKRSIELSIEDGGLTARVRATAEYASYVEWGTRFMNAQPFIRPAFAQQAGKFKNDMNKLVR